MLETCYLTTNVRFIILENERETFDAVGLEEGVDFCLAEHRRRKHEARLLSKSELQLSLKIKTTEKPPEMFAST